MTAESAREFTFTSNLDEASLPLVRTALQGVMSAYGIDDDEAEEAAVTVENYLAGLTLPKENVKLIFKLLYDGGGGSFSILTDSALDLSGLCKVMAGSQVWSAHTQECKDASNTTEIVVELMKEK